MRVKGWTCSSRVVPLVSVTTRRRQSPVCRPTVPKMGGRSLAYVPRPRCLFARRRGESDGAVCSSPFFPRVLKHFVAFCFSIQQGGIRLEFGGHCGAGHIATPAPSCNLPLTRRPACLTVRPSARRAAVRPPATALSGAVETRSPCTGCRFADTHCSDTPSVDCAWCAETHGRVQPMPDIVDTATRRDGSVPESSPHFPGDRVGW